MDITNVLYQQGDVAMARLDYFAPGVYVEEVNKGSRAIQGISMSVAGFVGFTEDVRGDAELFEPILITSWDQYLSNFAKLGSDGFAEFKVKDRNGREEKPCWAYLPFAVKGWFENGGGRCWVVSIGTNLPILDEDEASSNDEIRALTAVSTAGRRPSLTFETKQEAQGRLRVHIKPDVPPPSLPAESDSSEEEPFDTGEYFQLTVMEGQDPIEGPFRHLTMQPYQKSEAETSTAPVVALKALESSQYLNVSLGEDENGIAIDPTRSLPLTLRPADGFYEVRPPVRREKATPWYRKTYGSEKRKTGVVGLFQVDDVAMVACPDLMLAYQQKIINLQQLHGIMEVMITSCERAAPGPAYRMVVLDPPPVKKARTEERLVKPEQQNPQDVEEWLMDGFGRRSQFAALYYPWIQVPNPRNAGKPITIPPSGHMMGLWCRTDESRGIHKAPANEVPRGSIGLAYDVNFREQELLNPAGINCIRKFRNRGTLVWGARTLAQKDDTDWRYVSVRRLMSYIEKSIEEGTQWAVFEPNDEDLWARVTRTAKNFLERMWRSGALFGSTPEEAFYVKCDSELNTPETIKLGQLFVEVGVSPVRPAEFVVFRISQWDPSQDQA